MKKLNYDTIFSMLFIYVTCFALVLCVMSICELHRLEVVKKDLTTQVEILTERNASLLRNIAKTEAENAELRSEANKLIDLLGD
jgi:cell division protein FtsB